MDGWKPCIGVEQTTRWRNEGRKEKLEGERKPERNRRKVTRNVAMPFASVLPERLASLSVPKWG